MASNIEPKEYKDQVGREKLKALISTLKSVAEIWFEIKETKIAEVFARST